jgi:hypothetical protein
VDGASRVREDGNEIHHATRVSGLLSELAQHGLLRVLPVLDAAAGRVPDPRHGRRSGGPDEQHSPAVVHHELVCGESLALGVGERHPCNVGGGDAAASVERLDNGRRG